MEPLTEDLCVICRKNQTQDRYELDDYEMDTLVHELGVKKAASIQNKYGSVPICVDCFEKTGFSSEMDEEEPPLIQLKPPGFDV
ncbi:MAG TPA: hypothetical protein VFC63_26180 [Blastocatellia bacterium]|nr:hypothetical protein [Blastocatellia bacterium]